MWMRRHRVAVVLGVVVVLDPLTARMMIMTSQDQDVPLAVVPADPPPVQAAAVVLPVDGVAVALVVAAAGCRVQTNKEPQVPGFHRQSVLCDRVRQF